jgi:hypothetical protein
MVSRGVFLKQRSFRHSHHLVQTLGHYRAGLRAAWYEVEGQAENAEREPTRPSVLQRELSSWHCVWPGTRFGSPRELLVERLSEGSLYRFESAISAPS